MVIFLRLLIKVKNMKSLLNKNILVTGGPCWVPLDKVRVITNIFSGALSVIIVKYLLEEGANVTFLFGPGRASLPKDNQRLKLIKFRYFQDLLELVKENVKKDKYDVMIHSAAVSDYTPIEVVNGKIKSGKDSLKIELKPTIKIIDLIKKIDPDIFLVKFKLEVDKSKDELVDIAYNSMVHSNADLIVANDFNSVIVKHEAYIVDRNKSIKYFSNKDSIAKGLVNLIIDSID